MKIKKWNIYLADLNPAHKAEPGKVRPVVVVQTDLLNNTHPTTIICPITSNVEKKASLLRVNVKIAELKKDSDILVDQIRAIDNTRFKKFIGVLGESAVKKLKENLYSILD